MIYPLVVFILFGYDPLWAQQGEQMYATYLSRDICEANANVERLKHTQPGVRFECVPYYIPHDDLSEPIEN